MSRLLLVAAFLAAACGGGDAAAPTVAAGEGIGEVRLGMRYVALRELLGEPDGVLAVNRQAILMFDGAGLEVVMASALDDQVSDDAYVLGISAMPSGVFEGPAPGMTRTEIEALVGAPSFEAARTGFWERGMSVVWRDDVARQVAVFAPFTLQTEMPEMQPALGGAP